MSNARCTRHSSRRENNECGRWRTAGWIDCGRDSIGDKDGSRSNAETMVLTANIGSAFWLPPDRRYSSNFAEAHFFRCSEKIRKSVVLIYICIYMNDCSVIWVQQTHGPQLNSLLTYIIYIQTHVFVNDDDSRYLRKSGSRMINI